MYTSRLIFVDCVGLDLVMPRHPVPFEIPSGVTCPLLPGSRDPRGTCLLWEPARGPPRSRQLPAHLQLGGGVGSVLRLPGARHQVAGEGHLMLLLQYLHCCHAILSSLYLYYHWSKWSFLCGDRSEYSVCVCAQVFVYYLRSCLCAHLLFFFSSVNDQTFLGFGN